MLLKQISPQNPVKNLFRLRCIRRKLGVLTKLEETTGEEVAAYFRYPDLTKQCIYLAETIAATMLLLPAIWWLDFLLHYDELKANMQATVDMPGKEINRFVLFTHQNEPHFQPGGETIFQSSPMLK